MHTQDCAYGDGRRAVHIAACESALTSSLYAAKRLPDHREEFLTRAVAAARELITAIENKA